MTAQPVNNDPDEAPAGRMGGRPSAADRSSARAIGPQAWQVGAMDRRHRAAHTGSRSGAAASIRAGGCATKAQRLNPCAAWPVGLFWIRAPPLDSPKPQCLRRSARGLAAQGLSAFSTGLTGRPGPARVGGCANGLRIACGAGLLGVRCHHSLVTPIDWKQDDFESLSPALKGSPLAGDTY